MPLLKADEIEPFIRMGVALRFQLPSTFFTPTQEQQIIAKHQIQRKVLLASIILKKKNYNFLVGGQCCAKLFFHEFVFKWGISKKKK